MTLTFSTPQLIWIAAIALIVIAVGVFMGLVAVRAVSELRNPGRDKRKRLAVRELLAFIKDNERAQPDSLDLPRRQRLKLEKTALALLDDLRGPEREAIIRFLMAIGTMTRAINAMQSRRPQVRERYATMLGLFPDERATNQLEIALNDRDLAVRLAAASSLLSMERGVDLQEVMTALDRDGALTRARQLFHGEGSVELDQADAPHMLSAKMKLFGLEVFGGEGSRIAADTLVREIRDPDWSIQATALRAVRDEKHPALTEAIVEALDKDDWKVQVEAVAAAGRLGLDEASGKLTDLADQSDWQVRNAAVLALRRIEEAQAMDERA